MKKVEILFLGFDIIKKHGSNQLVAILRSRLPEYKVTRCIGPELCVPNAIRKIHFESKTGKKFFLYF